MAEDTMYLTVHDNKDGAGLIAVITCGHPRAGDETVTILSVERVPSIQDAEKWYERMKVERPWEIRQ